MTTPPQTELTEAPAETPTPLLDWLLFVAGRWRRLALLVLVAGAAGWAGSYLMEPEYTARASLLPPLQQTSPAAGALASLGGLSGLAGSALSMRTATDQYIVLMQSARVTDQIVDAFDLQRVYEKRTRDEARRALQSNTRLSTERKDSLIAIEVDDTDPLRAAGIANRYVDELRTVAAKLALTEAQQRRVFFERELQATRERLAAAQQALQGSGFSAGALRAEPRAAAEAYAKLRAEATQADVTLQTLRRSFTDEMPEVQRQLALVSALRAQLGTIERARPAADDADYIGRYREYKYQEALFEVFSRQYETARLDEAREGQLIQVVDAATPPERRSRPKRRIVAAVTALAALLIALLGITALHACRSARRDPAVASKLDRLRSMLLRWT
jgi:uncharacterized protein involved in exopolysaccharide biosynthesis